MDIEKSSKEDTKFEDSLTLFVKLYILAILLGFSMGVYGITHENTWEKLGNLLIMTTSVAATVIMVYFIALQTKATRDMAKKTSAQVQLTYDMVKQTSHQVSIMEQSLEEMKRQAELMNKSLIEMRKERMNIDFLVQYVIGYFKKVMEVIEQNDKRLRDPRAIKSGSLKLSPLIKIESFVEEDFREAKKRNMDPVLLSSIGPYDSAYEVGMKYRIARTINKVLERYRIDISGYNELVNFDFNGSDLEEVTRRCEQIKEKGKEISEKINKLLNNESQLEEEFLKR